MDLSTLIERRRTFVIAIYFLAAVSGAKSVLGPDVLTRILIPLGMAILLTQFCYIDSIVRGRQLPWSVRWLIFFFWIVAVPIYLFWSRGLRATHWILLYIIGLFAASYIGAFTMGSMVNIAQGLQR